jgi:ketosteroid isomerase-like protein
MAQEKIEQLQRAYEGWKRGDVEPYVALMHPDLYWEGVSRGILWWRRTPS